MTGSGVRSGSLRVAIGLAPAYTGHESENLLLRNHRAGTRAKCRAAFVDGDPNGVGFPVAILVVRLDTQQVVRRGLAQNALHRGVRPDLDAKECPAGGSRHPLETEA